MMRKILLFMFAVCVATTSVKADKLDLLKAAEFRVGSEYCTSPDSLEYVFAIKGDSVLVDEIVLANGNGIKAAFEVKEGESSLFKENITNNMTTGEMKNKAFVLKVGHSYIITWGEKAKWRVKFIKKQPEVADLMVHNDSTIQIKKQESLLNKAGETFIFSDSLITISSIGFDNQYMGDSLIIAVAGKDSIRMVYENKIVRLKEPFELLKSQNYVIVLKKDNQVLKAFAIGEHKKSAFPMCWIIGLAMVLVILITVMFFLLIRRKKQKSDSNNCGNEAPLKDDKSDIEKETSDKSGDEPERIGADNFLVELIGERQGFDPVNKQACMDELKRILDEYDAVKIVFQDFESKLEDEDFKNKSLKDKLEEFLKKYKNFHRTETDKKRSSVLVKSDEISFAERLNLISKDDELDINKFVLRQLEIAGFKDIDCNTMQYTDYLKTIVGQLAKKSADEETLGNKVRYKLKQLGLDLKNFTDVAVKQALESALLGLLNAANFEGTTVEEVFNKINEKIVELDDIIKGQKEEIEQKQAEIQRKVSEIDIKQNEINTKEVEITNLNDTIGRMRQQITNLFLNDLGALKEACNDIFFVPGTYTSEAECMAVEDSFLNHLKKDIEQLKSVELTENVLPIDCYDEFQHILEAELRNVDGAFNAICRYYAYSRIPFMADDIEYGKKFKRNAMFKLFNTLDKLLTDFGLQVIIPNLFADTLADGEDLYEDYTGQKDAYSDLNNLCPNVKYRKEHVDYTDKSLLIYDIIAVGYSINGQIMQKAKVLI